MQYNSGRDEVEARSLFHDANENATQKSDMELFKLEAFFNVAPCIRLFRSQHAAYIVFFLYKHFKATHKTLWTQSELSRGKNKFIAQ